MRTCKISCVTQTIRSSSRKSSNIEKIFAQHHDSLYFISRQPTTAHDIRRKRGLKIIIIYLHVQDRIHLSKWRKLFIISPYRLRSFSSQELYILNVSRDYLNYLFSLQASPNDIAHLHFSMKDSNSLSYESQLAI